MHVLEGDVAPIGAGMHGDAARPCRSHDLGGVEDARNAATARVSNGRDLVDVDAEAGHRIMTSSDAIVAEGAPIPKPRAHE